MTDNLLDIPQAFCQECRLCCRFVEPDRQTPFASRVEIRPILPDTFLGQTSPDLTPVRADEFDLWQCTLLEEGPWSCRIWPHHPLDCRIYPLMLILHEGSPWIGIDTNCPFASHFSRETLRKKAENLRDIEWQDLSDLVKNELIRHLAKESTEGVVPLLSLLP